MPAVPIEIATADESLVALLLAPESVATGATRELSSGALLSYDGRLGADGATGAPVHGFRLEFATPNVAAVAANWLWSQLHGHAAELRIAGAQVPMNHAAIKAALLEAAGVPQPI